MTERKRILPLGTTGSGKSALGNFLLGGQDHFQESQGVDSETKETIAVDGRLADAIDITVIDTPGYLDTRGEDLIHFTKMVEKVKQLGSIDMVILVLNLWVPRFDDKVQEMLRVFFKMFRHSNMWDNFAIVFTRAYKGQVRPSDKEVKRGEYCVAVREFVQGMGAKMACNPPCYFIDAHPEEGPPDNDTLNERASLAGFLASLSPMSTSQLEDPGEYMTEEEETKILVTEKDAQPVFESYPIIEQVPVLGKKSGFSIGFGGFSVSVGGGSKVAGWKSVTCGSANRLAGQKVSERGVIVKRFKRLWFDGKTVTYTPWEEVDSYFAEKEEKV